MSFINWFFNSVQLNYHLFHNFDYNWHQKWMITGSLRVTIFISLEDVPDLGKWWRGLSMHTLQCSDFMQVRSWNIVRNTHELTISMQTRVFQLWVEYQMQRYGWCKRYASYGVQQLYDRGDGMKWYEKGCHRDAIGERVWERYNKNVTGE